MTLRARDVRSSCRRGATITVVAILTPLLLGFTALAVDVGLVYSMEAETQNAVDAAALAGASALAAPDGTTDRSDAAEHRARDYLDPNLLSSTARPTSVTIEIGRWLEESRTFLAGDNRPNAVNVIATRNDAPLFFAGIFGMDRYNLTRSAIAMIDKSPPCKVWGLTDLRMHGGSNTDSYDSTLGAYNPGQAGSQGHVCSCRQVTLNGSPTIVNGYAVLGAGYDLVTTGQALATSGEATIGECPNPTIDFSGPRMRNDNALYSYLSNYLKSNSNGDYVLGSHEELVLPGGTYFFDSLTMNSGSVLTFTGPATVYVEGDIKITGGAIVNASMDPWNLTIYCASNSVDWTGSTDFYGSIISPNADTKISGGSDYYGAVVGGTLDVGGGSDIHVDESLPSGLFQFTPPALVR